MKTLGLSVECLLSSVLVFGLLLTLQMTQIRGAAIAPDTDESASLETTTTTGTPAIITNASTKGEGGSPNATTAAIAHGAMQNESISDNEHNKNHRKKNHRQPVRSSPFSDMQKILHTVTSTLEKARPYMEEIGREAMRLEQSAKRFGEGVVHGLTNIFEKLFSDEFVSGGSHSHSHSGSHSDSSSITNGADQVLLATINDDVNTAESEKDQINVNVTSPIIDDVPIPTTTPSPLKQDAVNDVDSDAVELNEISNIIGERQYN